MANIPIDRTQSQNESVTLSSDAKSAARRRLLRVGVKAAPVVVATLASRQALACHCVIPSAWGSINTALGADQEMGQNFTGKLTGSLARYQGAIRSGFSPYYISAWTSNDAAWQVLAGSYPFTAKMAAKTLDKKILYLKGIFSNPSKGILPLTVGAMCSAMGFTPPKGSSSDAPQAMIAAGGFKAAVLVAELNMFLNKIPGDCLTRGMLNKMAICDYTPVGESIPWTESDIADYLHFNWIARR